MTKNYSVLMRENNPPRYIVRSPNHPDVIKSGATVYNKAWAAPDLVDPQKRKTYSIGESRQINNGVRGLVVVYVFERRLTAHVEELVRIIQE